MKGNRYEEYIELMRVAYPYSTERFETSRTQGKHVHIDTPRSFSGLNDYLQSWIIDSLKEQIGSGKRRLRDTDSDNFKINKRRAQ